MYARYTLNTESQPSVGTCRVAIASCDDEIVATVKSICLKVAVVVVWILILRVCVPSSIKVCIHVASDGGS